MDELKTANYTYDERKAKVWWGQQQEKLKGFSNVDVLHINAQGVDSMVKRSMQLQCNIQDGEIYLNDDNSNYTITLDRFLSLKVT